jgi:hypothetical protein
MATGLVIGAGFWWCVDEGRKRFVVTSNALDAAELRFCFPSLHLCDWLIRAI